MPKIKIVIVGATGYTGIELLRILFNHAQVEITAVTSEKHAGKRLDQVFPFLQGKTDLVLEKLSDDKIAKKCLCVFSCLPHKSAMAHVPKWIKKGTKVVDLSADFRFRSPLTYEEWYEKHSAPELLKETVYGLPELHRAEIKKSFLVGNPGCYPTGAILGLAPLIKERAITFDRIVIDSKSGVTGAGRGVVLESLFSEVNESVHAYKVGRHRHTPEIEQEISLLAGEKVTVTFAPHLIPMDRGILSTLYAHSLRKTDTKSVLKIFSDFYRKEPFVKVLPEGVLPKTKEVRGTNNCAIGAVFDPRTDQIIVVAAIDNLMKGAASQAVQNMNIMYGFDEKTGLETLPLLP
jgi:N-acetyl-gamma-glutamyl-phosphate reductase